MANEPRYNSTCINTQLPTGLCVRGVVFFSWGYKIPSSSACMEKSINSLCKSIGIFFFFKHYFCCHCRLLIETGLELSVQEGRNRSWLFALSWFCIFLLLPSVRLGKWCWIVVQTVVSWITSRSSHELETWGKKEWKDSWKIWRERHQKEVSPISWSSTGKLVGWQRS